METQKGRRFIGRFSHQADLLESLTELCRQEKIQCGVFMVIGAVTALKLGYYDQDKQQYQPCVDLEKKCEIISCIGNISIKDGEIFVHAHITVADLEGRCYGGHLMPGAKIFAAEYYVDELIGEKLVRAFDKETGLSLWERK